MLRGGRSGLRGGIGRIERIGLLYASSFSCRSLTITVCICATAFAAALMVLGTCQWHEGEGGQCLTLFKLYNTLMMTCRC
jgi:hypothetical protein